MASKILSLAMCFIFLVPFLGGYSNISIGNPALIIFSSESGGIEPEEVNIAMVKLDSIIGMAHEKAKNLVKDSAYMKNMLRLVHQVIITEADIRCNNEGAEFLYKSLADGVGVDCDTSCKLMLIILHEFQIQKYSLVLCSTDGVKVTHAVLKVVDPGNECEIFFESTGGYIITDEDVEKYRLSPGYSELDLNGIIAFSSSLLGNNLMALNECNNAKKAFKISVDLFPNDPENCWNMAAACFNNRDYNEANNYFQQNANLSLTNWMATFKCGICNYEMGNYIQAEKNFSQSLTLNSSNPDALEYLASIYYNKCDYTSALRYYIAVSCVTQASSENYYYQAMCYRQMSNLVNAAIYFEKAFEIDQSNSKSIYFLAQTFADLNKHQQAMQCFEKAISISKTHFEYYLGLAKSYIAIGNYESAVSNLLISIDIKPDQSFAYINLGNINLDQKNYNQAINFYQQAKQYAPQRKEELDLIIYQLEQIK